MVHNYHIAKAACPKNFTKIPKLPPKGLHPCAGCRNTFYDEDNGLLTCPVHQEAQKPKRVYNKKVKINVEEIKRIQKRRAEINKLDLQNIEFYEDGVKLDISPEKIKEFSFIGLNNVDFIALGFYRE